MSVNLFNANFYRAANPDLASFNDAQAFAHLLASGLDEGRAFSPFVDLKYYRAANSDLASLTNQQLFNHLETSGVAEDRQFSPLVDLDFYKAANSDLAKLTNEQLFNHLETSGVAEGRRFSPFVDLNFYKAANGDLASLNYNQELQHLETYGLNEGRRFSPFVDLRLYQAASPDLAALSLNNTQLLDQLANSGVNEGRRLSISFDPNYYQNTYSDLAAAGFNGKQLLEHFELNGLNEGRASSESFNVQYYVANNPDLKATGFNYQQAQQHFELFGFQERRLAAPRPAQIPVPPHPGDALSSAFNLGVLTGNHSIKQFVGTTEPNDYYRFTLASTSNFNLSFSGLTNYADVQLIYDSNGNGQADSNETLASAYGYSSYSNSISKTLGEGTYYIRVYPSSASDNTSYTLNLSVTPSPAAPLIFPGNTVGTASDIGTLSSNTSTFKNFVGSADSSEYYRFSLAGTSNFNLSLNGLTDSANAQLIYDNNGNGQVNYDVTLASAYGSSYSPGSISKTLGAGTYYIHVYTNSSSYNTNYTLDLSATPTPHTTPSDPGSTLGTALDIGYLSGSRTYKDFVGTVEPDDYYRFSLASNSTLKLSLTGLTDSANVQLIYDNNGNGQADYNDVLASAYGSSYSPGLINQTLGAGTYYIHVDTYSPSYNTNYTLNLLSI